MECVEFRFALVSHDPHLSFIFRQTAARPGSQHLKCLLRVTFVPKDAYDLLSRDPTAFDYFYLQVGLTLLKWL